MFDTEALIIAVEKCPCLWDINHEHYHDRDMKDFAWEQVCAEIHHDNWDTEEKSKKILCTETKKKWNNIRDCYRRDINKLKNTPMGSSAKKPKKYVYSDLLSFLTPTLHSRSNIFSLEGNYSVGNNSSDVSEQETENQRDNAEDEEGVFETMLNGKERKYKRTSKKDIPSEILDILRQRRQKPKEQDDDDTKFLLSFRSDMKEMSKSQKLEFKIGVLQLLKKINEPTQ